MTTAGARRQDRKTLEEFDFAFQRSVKIQAVEHLGQLRFLHARDEVVLLGPPGTAKTDGGAPTRVASLFSWPQ